MAYFYYFEIIFFVMAAFSRLMKPLIRFFNHPSMIKIGSSWVVTILLFYGFSSWPLRLSAIAALIIKLVLDVFWVRVLAVNAVSKQAVSHGYLEGTYIIDITISMILIKPVKRS